MDKVAEVAIAKGETHGRFVRRFVSTIGDLMDFIKQVNAYVAASVRMTPDSPPIPNAYFMLIGMGIKALESGIAIDKSLSIVLERSIPLIDKIISKDVTSFAPIATELFAEAPKMMVDCAVGFIESGDIPSESLDDIFDYVKALVSIAIRREIIARSVGDPKTWPAQVPRDIITDDALLEAARKIGGILPRV